MGAAFVDGLPKLSPGVRSRVLRALLGRSDWIPAFVERSSTTRPGSPSWRSTRSRPWPPTPTREIAARAKTLLEQGGGLPDPDRQQVIDRLTAQLKEGGDRRRGKLVFQQQCAKCHRHGGEGRPGRPRPLRAWPPFPATSS